MAKKKSMAKGISKVICRKFTLRDNGGILSEVELLIKHEFPKPSLNSWIIEAIKEKREFDINRLKKALS